MSEAVLEDVRAQAEAGYPEEICGLLVGAIDANAREFFAMETVPATNRRADEAHRRYLIDPDAYRSAEKRATSEGREIVGVYHSHPDAPARPSEHDRRYAWPNSAYLIASVLRGEARDVTAWLLTDDRALFEPLEITIEPEALPRRAVARTENRDTPMKNEE